MNLANRITLVRIFGVPVFVVVMELQHLHPAMRTIGMVLFLLIALTDSIDGHIARSRNMVTDFGTLLDPLADKILVAAALLQLCGEGVLAPWMVLIMIGRELAVSTLRAMLAAKGTVFSAVLSGKLKTLTQIIGIIYFLSPLVQFTPDWFDFALGLLMTAMAIWATIDYFAKGFATIKTFTK